jgi:hypothetical protein
MLSIPDVLDAVTLVSGGRMVNFHSQVMDAMRRLDVKRVLQRDPANAHRTPGLCQLDAQVLRESRGIPT